MVEGYALCYSLAIQRQVTNAPGTEVRSEAFDLAESNSGGGIRDCL